MKFLKNILFIFTILSVSLITGCTKTSVHVEHAKLTQKPFIYQSKIKIEAGQTIPIIPAVSGKIISGNPDIGQKVKAGDILFEIDSSTYKMQLDKLSSQHSENKTVYEDDASALSLVKKGIITRAEYNKLLQRKGLAHTSDMRNDYQYETSLNILEKMIESCTVRTPIDGVIAEVFTRQSEMALSGKPALTIRQDDYVCGNIILPYSVGEMLENASASNDLHVELIDGKNILTGNFKYYHLENGNKTYKAEFDNRDGKVKIGQEYTIRIECKNEIQCFVLPSSALINEDSVAIVTSEGLVDFKTVNVIYNDGENITVIDGLNENDKIITNPPHNLEMGTEIKEI